MLLRLPVFNFIKFFTLLAGFMLLSGSTKSQLIKNVVAGNDYPVQASSNTPVNGCFDNSWASMIYERTLFHGSDQIIQIGFYVNNAPANYTMLNQQIYMRLTAANTYSSTGFPGTAGFTKVYDGPVTYNGSGWAMITLTVPFSYDINFNLEVLFVNGDGSSAAGCPTFRFTDAGATKTIRGFYNGSTLSTANDAGVPGRPNTRFVFPTPTGISCVTSTPARDGICVTTLPVTDLNRYCGKTSGTYTPSRTDPNYNNDPTVCGTVENTSWLKFTATATTMSFNIIVDSCLNNAGIQVSVYDIISCGTGFSNPLNYTTLACWNPTNLQPKNLSLSGLTVGKNYFVMIDGYAGDECKYVFYIPCANEPFLNLSSSSSSVCGTNSVTVTNNTFGNTTKVNITHNGAGTVTATATVSPFSFSYTPALSDAGKTILITLTTEVPAGSTCVPATKIYSLEVKSGAVTNSIIPQ